MHHALEIQEILFNIFGHCHLSGSAPQSELVSLARTCRTFKEPALDVLWELLQDLSPLTRCLPEASCQLSPNKHRRSFLRPLTQSEWDTLQSYTRRVRSVRGFKSGLDKKSVEILLNPPTTDSDPLFPNLRSLRCKHTTEFTHLLQLHFPSLISLVVGLNAPQWFSASLRLFSERSPNIAVLSLHVVQSNSAFNALVSNCICQWRHLQCVNCPTICLNTDALSHLARIPALTQLNFRDVETLPNSIPFLSFSNLRSLTLYPISLGAISQLLSRIRLPVIKEFAVTVTAHPSKQEIASFLAGLQTSNAGNSIKCLSLRISFIPAIHRSIPGSPILCFSDLQSCTSFINLRLMYLDLGWNVSLTNSDLLMLASAWPHLRHLEINSSLGWNSTTGGITPNGLLELLQRCPSLRRVALVMDTRDYTELPPEGGDFRLTSPHPIFIDVLDSVIEQDSVPAIIAFFSGMKSCPPFSLHAWSGTGFMKPRDWMAYRDRWDEVRRAGPYTYSCVTVSSMLDGTSHVTVTR